MEIIIRHQRVKYSSRFFMSLFSHFWQSLYVTKDGIIQNRMVTFIVTNIPKFRKTHRQRSTWSKCFCRPKSEGSQSVDSLAGAKKSVYRRVFLINSLHTT